MAQINGCGERAASRYPNITYWTYNWRKAGGSQRMIEISKRENFYQQEYCGCVYSLRDTNKWRTSQGRGKLKLERTIIRSEYSGYFNYFLKIMSETWNKLREEASIIASKERILSKILTEYVLEKESFEDALRLATID